MTHGIKLFSVYDNDRAFVDGRTLTESMDDRNNKNMLEIVNLLAREACSVVNTLYAVRHVKLLSA